MGCFIYCVMGTSKDVTLGPTAIMSLMTATFCSYTHFDDNIPQDQQKELQAYFGPVLAVVLSLFSGILQFLMGMFHIGNVVYACISADLLLFTTKLEYFIMTFHYDLSSSSN